MFFKHCRHEKLSDIKDGYQYCLECNKAFPVEVRKCEHHWENVKSFAKIDCDKVTQQWFLLRCDKCGEMKNFCIPDKS